jgi:hypothetical protein
METQGRQGGYQCERAQVLHAVELSTRPVCLSSPFRASGRAGESAFVALDGADGTLDQRSLPDESRAFGDILKAFPLPRPSIRVQLWAKLT